MSNTDGLSSKIPEDSSNIFKIIMNSRLLFNEDYNLVASAVLKPELGHQFRRGWMALAVAAAVNVGVSLVNKYAASSLLKSLSFIPACIVTVRSAHCIGKIIFYNYSTQENNKVILNHVRILQMFYKLMNRITHDINDLEKTARESCLKREIMKEFYEVFVTTVNEVNRTVSHGSIKLIQRVPHSIRKIVFSVHEHENLGLLFKNFDTTGLCETSPNEMNHMYQVIQSEYLRWLALCYSRLYDNLEKKCCIEVVNSVHSVILKCYCELNFYYIVNFQGLINEYRLKPIDKTKVASNTRADIQTDKAHSIMLHLVSLTEETQSFQSLLNISATLEVKNECSEDDLLKLFAIKFNEFKKKWRHANDCILKVDTDLQTRINICATIALLEKEVSEEETKYTEEYLAETPVSPDRVQVTSIYDSSDDSYLSFHTDDTNTISEDNSDEEYKQTDTPRCFLDKTDTN